MTAAPAPTPTTRVHTVDVPGLGAVPVRFTERGAGRPVLLLHGGAGPVSVAGFADLLADAAGVRVLVPVHPGFDGTDRPDGLTTPGGLGAVYAALLEALDLADVTVVGNSVGGWVAAELALLRPSRLAGLVLVDAVGLVVEGHPVADFFALSLPEIADYSYADPDRYRIDPAALTPQAQAVMAANRAALHVYGNGSAMADPGLRGRLPGIDVPTLVVWGDADRIVDVAHGRAYADAVPGARLAVLERTGHLPQIESPAALLELLRPAVG